MFLKISPSKSSSFQEEGHSSVFFIGGRVPLNILFHMFYPAWSDMVKRRGVFFSIGISGNYITILFICRSGCICTVSPTSFMTCQHLSCAFNEGTAHQHIRTIATGNREPCPHQSESMRPFLSLISSDCSSLPFSAAVGDLSYLACRA